MPNTFLPTVLGFCLAVLFFASFQQLGSAISAYQLRLCKNPRLRRHLGFCKDKVNRVRASSCTYAAWTSWSPSRFAHDHERTRVKCEKNAKAVQYTRKRRALSGRACSGLTDHKFKCKPSCWSSLTYSVFTQDADCSKKL